MALSVVRRRFTGEVAFERHQPADRRDRIVQSAHYFSVDPASGLVKPLGERPALPVHSASSSGPNAEPERAQSRLRPDGDRRYRTASFDLDADQPLTQDTQTADPDAILIVDGTFLQRPELRDHWDVALFVRTSAETAQARGLGRDAGKLGGEAAALDLYAKRYRPAYALYESFAEPEARCDAIIDNDDLVQPELHIRPGGRLA